MDDMTRGGLWDEACWGGGFMGICSHKASRGCRGGSRVAHSFVSRSSPCCEGEQARSSKVLSVSGCTFLEGDDEQSEGKEEVRTERGNTTKTR